MNLNHFEYFYQVAISGSIKEAARVLHVTQPTISTQIRKLEDHLQCTLFERGHRKLTLTSAGQQAFRTAERVFALTSDLEASIREGRQERTTIRLGHSHGIPTFYIKQLIQQLWHHPHTAVASQAYESDQLVRRLDRGDLDIAISDANTGMTKRHRTWSLQGQEIVALGRSQRRKYAAFPQVLATLPYIAFGHPHGVRAEVESYLRLSGVALDRLGESNDLATTVQLVTESGGWTAFSRGAAVEYIGRNKALQVLGSFKGIVLPVQLLANRQVMATPYVRQALNQFLRSIKPEKR